jgi:hypothetical protein
VWRVTAAPAKIVEQFAVIPNRLDLETVQQQFCLQSCNGPEALKFSM